MIFEDFPTECLALAVHASWSIIGALQEQIKRLEKVILSKVRLEEMGQDFLLLKTVWGVGDILGLTITLETGEVGRFPKVGNYASYCRCVASEYSSNGKKKGVGTRKNGNKYLNWAFMEAGAYARRYYDPARRFSQRKASRSHPFVAWSALAHKLCRASFYIMRDRVPFSPARVFG